MSTTVVSDDWKTSVEYTTGLANQQVDEQIAAEIKDIRWVKVQGVWVVERLSFKAWLQEKLTDPTSINEILRRLIAGNLISPARVTSQQGSTFRTHTLYAKPLTEANDALYAN